MPRHRRIVWICAIAIASIGLDQATKALARNSLSGRSPVTLLSGMVELVYSENLGAFLGLGARLPKGTRFVLGVLISGLLLAFTTLFSLRTTQISLSQLISLSFLVGGGASNLIDRIWNSGAVVDFLVLSLGPLHTGIFNLADVAITFGALASLSLTIIHTQHAKEDTYESVRSE